jgi:RNA polymerase sigma-70 factor (ECF subfamily)
VLEGLAALSEPDREALILVAWDGLDNHEAATVAGCSAATFAVRVHRARRRLQRKLRQSHDPPIDLSNEVSVKS